MGLDFYDIGSLNIEYERRIKFFIHSISFLSQKTILVIIKITREERNISHLLFFIRKYFQIY